tara:strand:- start:1872 stop:2957 length:1086 start_codon:yes stop_codon:yes gene_type:complete
MKILQVINSLRSGGAEKLIVDACIKYREQGLEVDLLLLDSTETPFYKTLKAYNEVKIIALGGYKNIYNPLNIFKLKTYLNKYDVIHVHLFPASYWVAFSKLITYKKQKVVFTEHNSTNRRRNNPLFKVLDTLVYKQFNKVVTISEAVDQNLKKHLGTHINKKIVKIYNGIDLLAIENAKPYNREELGFIDSDKLLLQVSSFTPQKDQKTVIRALPLLPSNYKLLLVGTGKLQDECLNLCKKINVQERVKFLGIRNDVPRLLKTVDVVILSSHFEGLSLSCIEGMASGKPFIATDALGLGEVVKGAGIIFEKNNDRQLSKIIEKLINDLEYKNKIVSHCQERAKNFDINNMVSRYIEMYESL